MSRLWFATLEGVVSRAAHEVRDSLNGVSVNLEVVRSRSAKAGADPQGIAPFARAASEQLEVLGGRIEALLYLSRPAREPVDVALTLKHLGALLVPAARSEGGQLTVEGYERTCLTGARGQAVRLVLAAAMLETTKNRGSGRCLLETGADPVVRFSHESAGACSLDPAIVSAVAAHDIRTERSDHDLILAFPGYSASHGPTH